MCLYPAPGHSAVPAVKRCRCSNTIPALVAGFQAAKQVAVPPFPAGVRDRWTLQGRPAERLAPGPCPQERKGISRTPGLHRQAQPCLPLSPRATAHRPPPPSPAPQPGPPEVAATGRPNLPAPSAGRRREQRRGAPRPG